MSGLVTMRDLGAGSRTSPLVGGELVAQGENLEVQSGPPRAKPQDP